VLLKAHRFLFEHVEHLGGEQSCVMIVHQGQRGKQDASSMRCLSSACSMSGVAK
jgi:hypothetical protein